MESRIDDASDLEDDEPTHLLVSDAEDAPIIRLVDAMIGQATDERASDIHIEPAGDRVRIRFRVDGVLHDASSTPKNVLRPVVSRLKVMGGCDISNSRTPQDGRFSVHGRDRHVDVRLTTLPTSSGEAVVLRLLDKTHGIFDLGALGFEADELARYQQSFRASQGAIITAGPTGSGKTSTLYATLRELNDPGRAIVSVEDPIEYHLDGIKQVQVGRRGGVGFAGALRAILRADPDVILIGEVRDRETALIAAEAALTGHLVLSTIHTLSAATVPVRLVEMGIEPYLVTSSLRCVVGQRLARRALRALPDDAAAPTEDELELLDDPRRGPDHRGRPSGRVLGLRQHRLPRSARDLRGHGRSTTRSARSSPAGRRAPRSSAPPSRPGCARLRVAGARRVRDGVFGPDELVRVLS